MKKFIFILIFALFITSCASGSTKKASDAAVAYIQAWADKDKAAITNYSCKEWEEDAILAIDGLLSVESKASDIVCEVASENDDTASVTCSGSMDLTYDGEIQSRSFSARTFSMNLEDSQWKVCSFE